MKLTPTQQLDIALFIKDVSESYRTRLKPRKDRANAIFEEISTFENKNPDKRAPNFKVNKAHEIVNKAVAKVMAGQPNWIVDSINYNVEDEEDMQMAKDEAYAAKEYLTKIYSKEDIIEVCEIVAKAMLTY